MSKIPQALSLGEETFQLHCEALLHPINYPQREYQFCEGRKWKFDFAWPYPDKLIAVEIEGGTKWGRSRHSKAEGFENDCRKYNAAARLGWKVYRFSTDQVVSGEAINYIKEVLS